MFLYRVTHENFFSIRRLQFLIFFKRRRGFLTGGVWICGIVVPGKGYMGSCTNTAAHNISLGAGEFGPFDPVAVHVATEDVSMEDVSVRAAAEAAEATFIFI